MENTPKSDRDQKINFKPIEEKYVHTIISNLDVKKATGTDNISAKLINSCSCCFGSTITNLVNKTCEQCKFPTFMKNAQVLPLFKTKDPLNKENYRAVSILPTI